MRANLRTALVCSAFAGLALLGTSLASCGSSGDTPGNGDDGGGNLADGGFVPPFGGDGSTVLRDGAIACEEQCPDGLVCTRGFCEPPQAQCTTNASCEYDSYCDTSGTCVPYGSPPDDKSNDPQCKLVVPPGAFAPKVFCEFKPAASDPFATWVDVQATPIVVNFNQGATQGPPSIVALFTVPVSGSYTETQGIIRVLRGTDCTLEANLGNGQVVADFLRSSSPVAVGDLDGDGVAEIVAYAADDSTIAFTRKAGVWGTLWASKKATTDGATVFVSSISGGWAGPSIHDLDDDGKPEIIREGYVINGQTGVLIAQLPADYASYSQGIPAVLANLDGDPKVEMTNGANVWEFDPATKAWADDPTYSLATPSAPGWTALADFNPFDGKKQPEIAVAETSTLSVFNLDHSVFMGMTGLAVPGTGGGPPTIADYDGDGLPEVGLAGKDFYTVYDPDCQATPRTGGKCGTAGTTACDTTTIGAPTACPTYILWSRKTQDHSSDITGSSVFDFEADGKAEVVYADECFARVYSGVNGDVLFSQYHSSCTWLENPVVADVDGDFRSELVVPSNTACGAPAIGIDCSATLDANGVDLEFAGARCLVNGDCVSGLCDQGYCRCQTSADCCGLKDVAQCEEQGTKCAPAPAGVAGTGNTCRAPHPHGIQGIRVYKDAQNRWVRSRTIWNQHAYAVTHVAENGTIPKTSAWAANWQDKALNDFRQNVPGEADGTDVGDVTAQAGPNYVCQGGNAVLGAPVCNRGTAPVGAGIPVGFYVGAQKVCAGATQAAIAVGACEVVTCTWSAPPGAEGDAVDVSVVANDGGNTAECDTQNDKGLVEHVFCAKTK